jgi:anti-sigma regulatory factor (Ser/Thr protein kinase)/predicted transcriptional regulator
VIIKDELLGFALKKGKFTTLDVVERFSITRQYAVRLLGELLRNGLLMKVGSTRGAYYVIPGVAEQVDWSMTKKLRNTDLKEHEVLEEIESHSLFARSLTENVRSIFEYAFSEMLNNAIEHSESSNITITVEKTSRHLVFRIRDYGIGVFRNVLQKRGLKSELEAMQDLLKGKTTTQPQAHSGEGIFFTSKIADVFSLESYDYRMKIDNKIHDVFFESMKPVKKGTGVIFELAIDSDKHLSDLFRTYQSDPEEPAFDKTIIKVKLYTMGTIHISRSQARRVLSGLEKFKSIILDFDQVPTVGQAFADEIFRVFVNKHPDIAVIPINMNEAVGFMVNRTGK